MRHAAAMLAVLILLCALPERAYAEELAERAAEEAGAYSLEEQLTDEEKEISGRLSFDGSYDAGGAIARVWKSFLNKVVCELKDNLSFGATLITIALLCALGGSLCSSKGISEYIEIAGCCGVAMIMLKGVDGILAIHLSIGIGPTLTAILRAGVPTVVFNTNKGKRDLVLMSVNSYEKTFGKERLERLLAEAENGTDDGGNDE